MKTEDTVKIVILQRGWVVVGRVRAMPEETITPDRIVVEQASVIRVWGTAHGLGEIAMAGPTSTTILDPIGRIAAYTLTTVGIVDCVAAKWAKYLK